jgi:hypothetical protein
MILILRAAASLVNQRFPDAVEGISPEPAGWIDAQGGTTTFAPATVLPPLAYLCVFRATRPQTTGYGSALGRPI